MIFRKNCISGKVMPFFYFLSPKSRKYTASNFLWDTFYLILTQNPVYFTAIGEHFSSIRITKF
jgi:hypothetical protein